MTILAWSKEFETGVDIVDRQHRELVDRINAAAPLLAASKSGKPANAAELLGALSDYVGVHFATEESLMREVGLDPRHVDVHRGSHKEFARHVREMCETYMANGPVTGAELLTFVAHWLIFHILGEDQSMARQIQRIKTGSAPMLAYAASGGTNVDPSKDVLTRTLIDMYMALSDRNRELQEQRFVLEKAFEKQQARLSELEAQYAEASRALDEVKSRT